MVSNGSCATASLALNITFRCILSTNKFISIHLMFRIVKLPRSHSVIRTRIFYATTTSKTRLCPVMRECERMGVLKDFPSCLIKNDNERAKQLIFIAAITANWFYFFFLLVFRSVRVEKVRHSSKHGGICVCAYVCCAYFASLRRPGLLGTFAGRFVKCPVIIVSVECKAEKRSSDGEHGVCSFAANSINYVQSIGFAGRSPLTDSKPRRFN